jgi:hypothetical protein
VPAEPGHVSLGRHRREAWRLTLDQRFEQVPRRAALRS